MARDIAAAIKGSLMEVEHSMAEVLTSYAGQLQVESQERPIQQREWLTAFLGRSFFSSDDETMLVRQTKRAMSLRHAIGEPMMYWDGDFSLRRGPYLVVAPDNYDPIDRDSFFRFTVEKSGSAFVGKITCNAIQTTMFDELSGVVSYNRGEVNVLEAHRIGSSLRCTVTPGISEDGKAGYIWGLSAIREAASQYPDVNGSALRHLERILPEMREAAAGLTAANPL